MRTYPLAISFTLVGLLAAPGCGGGGNQGTAASSTTTTTSTMGSGGAGGHGGSTTSSSGGGDAGSDAAPCVAASCPSGFCDGAACGENGVWGQSLSVQPNRLAPGPMGAVWAASMGSLALVDDKGVVVAKKVNDWQPASPNLPGQITIRNIAPIAGGGVAVTGSSRTASPTSAVGRWAPRR